MSSPEERRLIRSERDIESLAAECAGLETVISALRLWDFAMRSIPRPKNGYGTIVVDPPWRFSDQGSRLRTPYASLSKDEIFALPIDRLAATRAHLYLWTTASHLAMALACIHQWRFVFKLPIVWVKTTRDGRRLRIGGGHYLRHAHELCLFAARNQVGLVHDVPSVFLEPSAGHSSKPEALQDIAERLSPGPRLEMFARRQRSGWTCWGDQCPAT